MRTSWKVGLATGAFEPVPWATPRTNVVLPAPSSPVRSTTSPECNLSPSSIPACSVSAGEPLTRSGKVVVAARLEVSPGHGHGARVRQRADRMQAGLLDRDLRPYADQLGLLPTRQRVLERGSRRA